MKVCNKKIQPSFGYYYYPEENKIESMDIIKNYGLFSTFTLLLSTITIVHRDYKVLPNKFDLSNALYKFKEDKSIDIYKMLFKTDDNVKIDDIEPMGPNHHHEIYTDEKIKKLYPYIRRYFNLSDEVCEIKNKLIEKYELKDKEFLSVIYRGTDQFTDRGGFISVNCSAYEKLAKNIISNIEPKDRNILIQSEEPRVVNYFRNSLGAKFIEETDIGQIGNNDSPIPLKNVETWIKYYVASIHIHSKSKTLITYTGNSGFFTTLFRGSMENVYQETTFKLNGEMFWKK